MLPGENLFFLLAKNPSKTKTWQYSLDLQICIWTNHKTFQPIFFGQVGPKFRCLAITHSSTFEEIKTKKKKHMPNDDLGLFCSQRTRASCSHWANHELIGMPKDCRIKYGKAWPQLGQKNRTVIPSTEAWLKNKIKVLQWPSESPILTEKLW